MRLFAAAVVLQSRFGGRLNMWVTSPAYIGVLFRHPYGKYLIAGALTCLALGHLSIQRIVNTKV